MHQGNIVHCDIKPANVLLDVANDQLVPIIIDFGISRIVSEQAIAVKAFEAIEINGASIQYAAPEALLRLRLRRIETDGMMMKATDSFSLGMTLAEMLTRKKLYDSISTI